MRSPAVSSMSISRSGGTGLTCCARSSQLVGGVTHRRADHDDVVAGFLGGDDPLRHPLDAVGVLQRRATVLLDHERQRRRPFCGRRSGPPPRLATRRPCLRQATGTRLTSPSPCGRYHVRLRWPSNRYSWLPSRASSREDRRCPRPTWPGPSPPLRRGHRQVGAERYARLTRVVRAGGARVDLPRDPRVQPAGAQLDDQQEPDVHGRRADVVGRAVVPRHRARRLQRRARRPRRRVQPARARTRRWRSSPATRRGPLARGRRRLRRHRPGRRGVGRHDRVRRGLRVRARAARHDRARRFAQGRPGAGDAVRGASRCRSCWR